MKNSSRLKLLQNFDSRFTQKFTVLKRSFAFERLPRDRVKRVELYMCQFSIAEVILILKAPEVKITTLLSSFQIGIINRLG